MTRGRLTIFCAKCGRQVDTLEIWRDLLHMETVMKVSCHGDSQQSRADSLWLDTALRHGDLAGTAFAGDHTLIPHSAPMLK